MSSAAFVSSFRLRLASDTLHSGGVLAYPTEAIWGLGCDPDNTSALKRLIQLKRRDVGKGLILVAASADQLEPYIQAMSEAQKQLLATDFGHAVSWVVPATAHTNPLLTGGRQTLCVRVSTHPVVSGLCEEFGAPIVSTSANRSGLSASKTLFSARKAFGDSVDYYLAGATGGARHASEIRDLNSGATIRSVPKAG
ncbi:MAG: L-threonylcarbamoyladenylate synthase [Pseudomonadales bacterium]